MTLGLPWVRAWRRAGPHFPSSRGLWRTDFQLVTCHPTRRPGNTPPPIADAPYEGNTSPLRDALSGPYQESSPFEGKRPSPFTPHPRASPSKISPPHIGDSSPPPFDLIIKALPHHENPPPPPLYFSPVIYGTSSIPISSLTSPSRTRDLP